MADDDKPHGSEKWRMGTITSRYAWYSLDDEDEILTGNGYAATPTERVARSAPWVVREPGVSGAYIDYIAKLGDKLAAAVRADRARLRDGAAAMSNVMACVRLAFDWRALVIIAIAEQGRHADGGTRIPVGSQVLAIATRSQLAELFSREWSAEVRSRLKEREEATRLRVYAQGEED